MLDKIKSLLDIIKGCLIYILTPLFFLLGYIFYLKSSITSLKDNAARNEAEKTLADILTKKEKAHEEANIAEADYIRIRNEYLSSRNKS